MPHYSFMMISFPQSWDLAVKYLSSDSSQTMMTENAFLMSNLGSCWNYLSCDGMSSMISWARRNKCLWTCQRLHTRREEVGFKRLCSWCNHTYPLVSASNRRCCLDWVNSFLKSCSQKMRSWNRSNLEHYRANSDLEQPSGMTLNLSSCSSSSW